MNALGYDKPIQLKPRGKSTFNYWPRTRFYNKKSQESYLKGLWDGYCYEGDVYRCAFDPEAYRIGYEEGIDLRVDIWASN